MRALIGGSLNLNSINLSRRELATLYAWQFIGTSYKWGGDDPMGGFYCSGYCIEILKGVGVLSRHGDWTAQSLFDRWITDNQVSSPTQGCLVFWRASSGRISHVEYCVTSICSLGASGGDSGVFTIEDAIEQNAYIKLRPFGSRPNIAGFVDPFLGVGE